MAPFLSIDVEKHESGGSTTLYRRNPVNFLYLERKENSHEVLRIHRVVSLHDCDSLNGQVFDACLDKFIMSKLGCRLPWINKGNVIDIGRTCTTAKDLDNYMNLLDFVKSYDGHKELQAYGCLQSNCLVDEWYPQISGNYQELKDNATRFKMEFINTNCLKATKQILIYGFSNFVADFGGYLGLLLGASLLSIYDDFAAKIQMILNKNQ